VAKGVVSNWENLLMEDLSISASNKGRYQRFIEHYLEYISDAQLELGQTSLVMFYEKSCEVYQPNEERKRVWLDAKDWFLRCHSDAYEDLLKFELRRMNYALDTEKSYVNWARQFMAYHHQPKQVTPEMLSAFLNHLSVERHHSVNTQKSALNALVFLLTRVFGLDLKDRLKFVTASKGRKIPEVLSAQQVQTIFYALDPGHRLMAALLYGSGLRSAEMRRLRVKDINIERQTISIYEGKHAKDRMVMLPRGLTSALERHLLEVRKIYEQDRRENQPGVYMPHALGERQKNAAVSWDWYWLFPAHRLSQDPRSNVLRRHHVCDSNLRKAIQKAKKKLNFALKVSPHTFRHCFATHMLESGKSIHQVQDLMGHTDIRTTEIYLHTMKDPSRDESCMDTLGIKI
jgi:integron integrase